MISDLSNLHSDLVCPEDMVELFRTLTTPKIIPYCLCADKTETELQIGKAELYMKTYDMGLGNSVKC